jgi:hypothetical protein
MAVRAKPVPEDLLKSPGRDYVPCWVNLSLTKIRKNA